MRHNPVLFLGIAALGGKSLPCASDSRIRLSLSRVCSWRNSRAGRAWAISSCSRARAWASCTAEAWGVPGVRPSGDSPAAWLRSQERRKAGSPPSSAAPTEAPSATARLACRRRAGVSGGVGLCGVVGSMQ